MIKINILWRGLKTTGLSSELRNQEIEPNYESNIPFKFEIM